MIERVGNRDVLVRNYTSNFDVKEFIQSVLIPKAFPNVPMNKLNLGFTGVTSEYISQAIEDSYATAALMLNESFITRAVLPNSIYSEASLFDLGYTFATPSKCSFAVQIWMEDIIKHSTRVRNTPTSRYKLDKNTKLLLGNNSYRFDYDIFIDHQFIDGRRAFNVYYDITENNSIAIVTNRYVRHQVTSIGWLVLFVDLQEFDRKIEENTIADNLITTNSDIILKWSRQIAGMDLVYITPRGERLPMKKKIQHTRPDQDPFSWYSFINDNTLRLIFSDRRGFFQPAFNSKIESTIYTCRGAISNFDEYDNKSAVPVQRTGEVFEYNANTRMVALCYGGSKGGTDRGNIELLRDDVITAYNTVKVLSTDHDLDLWFNNFAKRHNTKACFFKRRDDPTGKLFSQFVVINDNSYVYPTNTLSIDVQHDQFDFVNSDDLGNNREFIIKPGHLWEYVDDSRDTVRMVEGTEGLAFVSDEALPPITTDRPFMFVNPFYIKVHRQPTLSANYNYLIDHTSWPDDIPIDTDVFYQFQLATLSIERSLSRKLNNKYRIQVICVPVISQDGNSKYIEGIGNEFPVEGNDLRLILVTRSRLDGETGYIEMKPIELRPGGAIFYETTISVHDNLRSDMMLEVDIDETPGITSLIANGPREGGVYIDSAETSFHFLIMMRDPKNTSTTNLYGNDTFQGYAMANRFANQHRDLILYKPMTMMRSVVTFAGYNNNFSLRGTLTPLLKYDVPLDEEKMSYFIRAFTDQYSAVEPVLKRLDGNSFLDFKLFNTYGRSNNYYIGPADDSDVLWDSNILLDNVHVKIKFRMAVHDRSAYVQTVDAVINEIKLFFESLDSGELRDIHVSDLIHIIKERHPNVNYIRFVGFNDYDANKQSIFVKYDDISELPASSIQCHVPELVRVSRESIEIIEEV